MGMMINRRRACGGSKSLLPSGYRQLEYIENKSNAYINTGVVASADLVTTITCKLQNKGYLFGVTPIQSTQYYGIHRSDTFLHCYLGSTGPTVDYKRYYVAFDSNNWHSYTAGLQFKYDNVVIADYSTGGTTLDFNPTKTINILTLTDSYINSYCRNAKVSSFTMVKAGVPLRNMIPCINPNNVVGMYDTVNGVFYSSPNGTAFVAGPEV